MFDSPLNDRMPGLLKLAGWPWRGLTTMPVLFGSGYPQIALPNGSTKTLTNVLLSSVSDADFSLPGDAILFRDPRAGAIDRTPAEQTADAAAGYQWLPYVIYPSWARIVYGRRINISWVWHDGEINHGLQLNGLSSARVSPLVIGRAAPSGQTIPLTQVGSYVSPLWSGETQLVVLDAMPDGSRVLVGRYQRYKRLITDPPALLAPCRIPLVEVWEIRLTISGGAVTGECECIRTPEEIVGTVSSPPRGEPTHLSIGYSVEWRDNGANWTAEVVEGGNTIGYWEPGYSWPGWSYSEAGRIISCYYNDDGVATDITMAISVDDTFSYSFDHSAGGTPAVADHVAGTGPNNILSPGSYEMQASYTNLSTSVTRVRLLDSGVLVSEAVLTMTGVASCSYSADLQITSDGDSSSSASSADYSGTASLVIDGVSILSASRSDEFIAQGGVHGRSVSSPGVQLRLDAFGPDLEFAVEPVRYSSQVHSLAVRRTSPDQSWIGHACHRGSVTPGMSIRAGAISHLFGTQNPATGQVVRDSSDPIVWI